MVDSKAAQSHKNVFCLFEIAFATGGSMCTTQWHVTRTLKRLSEKILYVPTSK
jgi:hypothetical protein